jgi:hypothetical protein
MTRKQEQMKKRTNRTHRRRKAGQRTGEKHGPQVPGVPPTENGQETSR